MRPGGKEGKAYTVAFGVEIVGDALAALPADGFYMVTARAVASALPDKDPAIVGGADIGVNDFFWGTTDLVPAVGDKVKRMTLTALGFAKDVQGQSSKQKFDDTTQEDVAAGVKSFTESVLSESTGSISGYYETDSPAQEEIERRFRVVIHQEGAYVTRKSILSGVWPFMLSRRETTEVGEIEVWEYKPLIVDQLTNGKPLEGVQEFNFNYTVDGKSHPAVFKRKVPAA